MGSGAPCRMTIASWHGDSHGKAHSQSRLGSSRASAQEMPAIRKAIASREEDRIPGLMSERWLSQVTLYGSVTEVRDGIEAWRVAGAKTVIVVPS